MWLGDWALLRRLMYQRTPFAASEISDKQHLDALRYDAARYGYKRPLVDWTTSPEWTDASIYTTSQRGAVNYEPIGIGGGRGCSAVGEIDTTKCKFCGLSLTDSDCAFYERNNPSR